MRRTKAGGGFGVKGLDLSFASRRTNALNFNSKHEEGRWGETGRGF